MKLRLLAYLRCPDCRGRFTLVAPIVSEVRRTCPFELTACVEACPLPERRPAAHDCVSCARLEVMAGTLNCGGCGLRYQIVSGVPRMLPARPAAVDHTTAATGSSFGFLWGHSKVAESPRTGERLHWRVMETALDLSPLEGLILDAGCGEGVDLEAEGRRPAVEIIGVDLSDGGCRASFEKAVRLPNVHVVQGDLARLPFDDDLFTQVYSYGVLHHLVDPQQGMNELGRVAAPDARVAVYVYEDFAERSGLMQRLLRLANQLRRVTTRLPHGLLYFMCRVASPLVYMLLTVPHRVLRRLPPLRRLADALPFRHGTGPFSLTGDLFDRFSAPLEYRYSASTTRSLMERGSVRVSRIANVRGWMASGVKESRV